MAKGLRCTKKANEFRKYGGLIPYLMTTVAGFRDFINDAAQVRRLTSDEFLAEMKSKFPSIDEYHTPSGVAWRNFRKHLRQSTEGGLPISVSVVMRDEMAILNAVRDLNVAAEYRYLFDQAKQLTAKLIESAQANVVAPEPEDGEETPLPAPYVSNDDIWRGLREQAHHLDSLTKILTRYNLIPREDGQGFGSLIPKDKDAPIDEGTRELLVVRAQQFSAILARKSEVGGILEAKKV